MLMRYLITNDRPINTLVPSKYYMLMCIFVHVRQGDQRAACVCLRWPGKFTGIVTTFGRLLQSEIEIALHHVW